MKMLTLKHISEQPGLVAKHAIAALIEYMVLNATTMNTDIVLEKLRTLALCWKEHRDQVRKTATIINDIKRKTGKETSFKNGR